MKRYDLGYHMTKYERVLGWIYLPFYIVLLSLILSFLFGLLGWPVSGVRLNAVYFCINLIAIVSIFHRFLWGSLCGIMRKFWAFLQALILGFVLYYAAVALLGLLYSWLFPELVNPNNASIQSLASESYGFTVLCTVVIAPLVEETLMRGLIFGTIQRKSRFWAYFVSIIVFAAIHLWQYVGYADAGTIALCALQYLPAGVALGWTYEKAGNIWACILLHMAINAISLGLMGFTIG